MINILNALFFCIVLNIAPIALLGGLKISSGLYNLLYAVAYAIQILVLLITCKKVLYKINKKEALILVVAILNSILSILFSFLSFQYFNVNEYIFIASLALNVLFFLILIPKFDVTYEQLVVFIEKMIFIGVISVAVNLVLNFRMITNLSAITNSYSVNFSSFFPNRNQFGLFMLIISILNALLITIKNKKVNKVLQVVFIINLILSMSRNSILGLVIFYIVRFISSKTSRGKDFRVRPKHIFILSLAVIFTSILLSIVLNNVIIQNKISELFIRADNLESGSGRFDTWGNGINIAFNHNIIFGVGRYLAIHLNHILYHNGLEYFHSLYVEKLATHGVIGLLWLLYVMSYVLLRVKKSELKTGVKSIAIGSIISFWIFSIFETTTRFSIGYADSIFLIFFFTFPLVLSNLKKDKALKNSTVENTLSA